MRRGAQCVECARCALLRGAERRVHGHGTGPAGRTAGSTGAAARRVSGSLEDRGEYIYHFIIFAHTLAYGRCARRLTGRPNHTVRRAAGAGLSPDLQLHCSTHSAYRAAQPPPEATERGAPPHILWLSLSTPHLASK